jgi:hypothetical protein
MSEFSVERMSICNSCPYNIDGQCILCGCELEIKVKNPEESCPHIPQFWGQYQEQKAKKEEPQMRINYESPPQFNGQASQQSNTCIPCNKHRH